MNRKALLLVFILLLVAVSWFRPAFCNPTAQDELIRQYLNSGNQYKRAVPDGNKYISPEIFGKTGENAPAETRQSETSGVSNYDTVSTTPEKLNPATEEKGLTPFGYDLFMAPSEMTQPSEVADAADYVLGPGDNIIIYLWGKVEKEYNLTIDRQGKVFIPKIG